MPSKKRKYNARFPAGRIKKIMQTDEEVGKVAQAVPIIISRTLELFVGSLLSKAMQVTMSRNAKTLSPSHVKQCILAESRFDFLRDLVKNVPDVSAAEEKETMSAESSPNASRFSDVPGPPRRVVREDSNSSSSCDTRPPALPPAPPHAPPHAPPPFKRALSSDTELPHRPHRTETITSTIVSADAAIDLSKREKPVRTANFYQETLTDEISHRSVITLNPTYTSPQPSTSYTSMTTATALSGTVRAALQRIDTVPKQEFFVVDNTPPATPMTPVTPILNIDFTKNLANPEIKVLDTTAASIVRVKEPRNLKRQNSKPPKVEHKKIELKPSLPSQPVDIDHLNSGNLQIDEDYDT